MSQVIVGKWGKNLAIRVPHEIAQKLGLSEGEPVEIAAEAGDIVIHRQAAKAAALADAKAAAAEIMAASAGMRLDGISIRDLIDEGRRG